MQDDDAIARLTPVRSAIKRFFSAIAQAFRGLLSGLSLILALAVIVSAQSLPTDDLPWKLIKEMSGEIPDHTGLTIEVYGAKIARGDDLVKLSIRFDFPWGAPASLFKGNAPRGFDVSSVARFQGRIELNCKTLEVKPVGGGDVYQFNGKRHKSKEPPFQIESGHIFATYFCEQGEAPTKAPTLKPK